MLFTESDALLFSNPAHCLTLGSAQYSTDRRGGCQLPEPDVGAHVLSCLKL